MKIYRFNYSCYCLKVEKALDILGLRYERVPVPYLDRAELVKLTDGYLQVPVLVDDAGRVMKESRAILERFATERLVPAGFEAASWAYHDWCDNQLEDILFRLAAPRVQRTFRAAEERAFYRFVKERKYGAGCIDAWEKSAPELLAKARELLAPTERTLAAQPFVLGARPTLADAALYGQFAMLAEAGADLAKDYGLVIAAWFGRMQ